MIPVRTDTHVVDGLALLIDAFKGRKVIDGILAAWLKQFQDLERVFWEILQGRGVDDAVGQQLDFLAAVVGEDRQGRSDDELRAAIRLRIRTNRSQGTSEDVIQTAALVLTQGNWEYADYTNAAFRVLYWGLPSYLFPSLVRAMRLTRPAGVRGYIMFAPSPLNEILFWTHTDGITPARHGAYTHTDGLPRRVMVHVETV